MALDDVLRNTEADMDESKMASVAFYNKREGHEHITDGNSHLHKQEYYDALRQIREEYGQAVNILVGEYLVAVKEADRGERERLEELVEDVLNYPDGQTHLINVPTEMMDDATDEEIAEKFKQRLLNKL